MSSTGSKPNAPISFADAWSTPPTPTGAAAPTPGAPASGPNAPMVVTQAPPPMAPPPPTNPGSPQQQPGLLSKAWNYVKSTISGDVGQNWDTLKRDFVASGGFTPEQRQAFHNGDFWGEIKAQYNSTVATGKLPLDAFNTAISPLTGAGDAATGVLAKAAFKVLPEVPGYGEEDFHAGLNKAMMALAPEDGVVAKTLGDTSAATTKVVSGRATATGAATATGEAASAAGETADASKVTFQAKVPGASADAWHNVGTMDKGDLQRFYDTANSYAGRSPEELNVTEENAPELHQGIGQFNIANFKAPGDVPLFMRAALDNIPAQVRPLSSEDLAAQVSAAAEQLGTNRDTISTFINNTARDAMQLPQAVGLARAAVQSIHGAIDADAKLGLGGFEDADLETARGHFDGTAQGNVASGPMSPEEGRGAELAKRLLNVQTGINWTAGLNDMGTGAGRALQSLQQPAVDLDGLMEHLRTLGADNTVPPPAAGANAQPPQSLADLDKFYRLWNAANDDPASRNGLLTGQPKVPPPGWYLRNSFANAFTGSLLAGKAIVKGYVMPAFMGAIETAERTSGGALMAINPFMDLETRQAGLNIAKASALSYYQTMGDFASAFRYSIDAVKNGGQSIIGGQYSALNKPMSRTGPITQEMLDAAKQPGDLRYILGNAINTWPRAVFSLIGGHDELTKQLGYAGRIRMQAMNYGLRNGISGQALTDLVHQSLSDSVNPATGAANYTDVLNEAARTSFLNKPDGPLAPVINSINSARQAFPELRYVLPVMDVPAAAVGAMMSRIPVVSALAQATRDDLLGHNGGIQQAQAYGRWMTGTAALGVGYGLARSGLLTGGGPQNPQDKAAWMNNGYQPYSIKIGGKWISYKDWEPIGGILGIIGTMTDHTVHYAEDDQTHSKVIAAAAALAEYTKDKAAMKGVSDLLSFGDADTAQQYVAKLAGSIPAGFVPAFVRYGRNLADNDLRDTKAHWFDQVLNSIPGESQALPPLRNVMGEPIHTPNDGSNLYGLLPITIASARAEGKDPVTDELDHIYQLTGHSLGVTHPNELSSGAFDTRSMQLENGQGMYDRFIQNRMLPNPLQGDQNTHDALAALFQTDQYKEAAYGSTTKATDALGQPSKLKMIDSLFQQADKYSKQQLAQESPLAKRYLAVGAAKADSPDLLRSHTADELAGNPQILSALGIDIKQYESNVSGGQ